MPLKDALYWEPLGDNKVHCTLCPQNCHIFEGRLGFCRVRANFGGKLKATTYEMVASLNVDPIEKKPLFHFYPGSSAFSIGAPGCNLACEFCQNWEISQLSKADITDAEKMEKHIMRISSRLTSSEAVERAREDNCISIAYTYTEPFIWYEYVLETAKLAKNKGLKNVLVTNGFVQESPLKEILPYIDAMNIDVKAYDEKFYKKNCKGRLEPVLRTVEMSHDAHVWLEVTNLIIPTLNDSPDEIKKLVDWLAAVDKNIPLHFSRYYPAYKLAIEPTPESTLERAKRIADEKLNYVYLGNVHGKEVDTRCPKCGAIAIRRVDFSVLSCNLDGDKCKNCGEALPIIGECKA